MKIKTSTLTDAALDWAVAKAAEMPVVVMRNPTWSAPVYIATNETGLYTYAPSTDWSQAGPIIERENIDLNHYRLSDKTVMWDASIDSWDTDWAGPTPLIAAMRCFCCSKLGDEIDIPEELCQSQNS